MQLVRITTVLCLATVLAARSLAGSCASPQCAELIRTGSDSLPGSGFGCDIAFDRGATVVGAQFQDLTGAAYVFRDQTPSGAWGQEAKLTGSDSAASDEFGACVGIDRDTIFVGASGATGSATASGAVYVFDLDPASGAWVETQKLVASDGAQFDYFGSSISLRQDIAAIGAFGVDNLAGAVYVFERDPASGLWSEVQKIVASDRAGWEFFGHSVGLGSDWLVAGAYFDQDGLGAGAAYTFEYDANQGLWVEHTRLAPFDLAPHDSFGYSVAVAGDELLVGSPYDDDAGTTSGSAYVFRYVSATDMWFQAQKLVAVDAQPGDRFGLALDLRALVAAVGATPSQQHSDRSAVYVLRVDGGGIWRSSQRAAPADPSQTGAFGRSIDVHGQALIVGSPGTVLPPAPGAVHFLELDACVLGTSYCGPAAPNSSGAAATIGATGSPVAAVRRLELTADQLPPGQFGFFMLATATASVPNPGGSQGVLCVGGTIARFNRPGEILGAGPFGTFSLAVDTTSIPTTPPSAIVAGQTWNFTTWYRDMNPGLTSNFSDAVTVMFQ